MVRKTVTLVFCDVADSTPLGEQLDPESLRDVLSRYHETARSVLERHGGTLEKFVGDAVLAVFGIPVVHEDDALRAVRAAAELRDALGGLNDELESAYGVRIAVRTGVHTGEVIAGDPAEGQAFATGDAVVVAQRLEASARGGEILVSDATHRLVRDAVVAEPLEPLSLKGKAEPVAALRLLEVRPETAGTARRLDSELVGRRRELATLRAELEHAVAERTCRVVAILGEPGVGKSRLAAELAASAPDARVLEGRCLPYGTGVTYWPLVEIVRRLDLEAVLAGVDGGDEIRERILEAVGRAEPRSRSDELYWAVRRLLEELARTGPLVLVLDDVHWAEPAFLDLVEYLAGWSRDAPILLVCLGRADLAELRPTWSGWTTISLGPLDGEESRALLENLGGPVDPAVAAALARTTAGNPLFLEEMLLMLVEDGLLVERGGRLEPAGPLGRLPVPETVQAVLAARLDRLRPEELAVLQRAAVIGGVFWWGAVADLSPPAEAAAVAPHLQALVRKGLVRPDPRSFAGEDGFRFGHILVRDAAYASMPKRLRADLHARFADWVEARGGDGAELDEILGHHLEQAYRCRLEVAAPGPAEAELARRAAAALARAGRRALVRADAHAAQTLLERAVAVSAEGAERDELRLDLAVAHHRGGALADALATLDGLLAAPLEPRLEWSARLERALVLLYTGEGTTDEVLDVAERAAGVFGELGDAAGLARTWSAVGTELFIRGRYEQMEEAARKGLRHAREAGDERLEAACVTAACVALALGPTSAETALARCRELLGDGDDHAGGPIAATVIASLEAMRGRAEEAWALYDAARESLLRSGARIALAGLPLYAQPLLATEPARAVEELRASYESLLELGDRGVLPTAAAFLAEALVERGAVEEAEELAEVSAQLTGPTDVVTHAVWRRARARCLARRGDDGRELAAEAVALARTTDSPHLLAGALAALAETGDEEALAEAARLWEVKGHEVALAALEIALRTP